ncbi:hypothetical protein Droror1_Dr00016870 [Drosera rotundifolia]
MVGRLEDLKEEKAIRHQVVFNFNFRSPEEVDEEAVTARESWRRWLQMRQQLLLFISSYLISFPPLYHLPPPSPILLSSPQFSRRRPDAAASLLFQSSSPETEVKPLIYFSRFHSSSQPLTPPQFSLSSSPPPIPLLLSPKSRRHRRLR